MQHLIDLQRYPIDQIGSPVWKALVDRSKCALDKYGMFNLEGFLKNGVAKRIASELRLTIKNRSFSHKRTHNIYFKRYIDGVDPSHPALATMETVGHTVCADQIAGSELDSVYQYEPLVSFLAAAMGKPVLFPMSDPLARLNVMAYQAGEALNWHFDRSEFTTTLLLQAPEDGAAFEYRTDLRSDEDPNYEGVANLLRGADRDVKTMYPVAGTLNVFRGKNTAHRVTPVEGDLDRVVAVFSYYERQGVVFSDEERFGFYGRAA